MFKPSTNTIKKMEDHIALGLPSIVTTRDAGTTKEPDSPFMKTEDHTALEPLSIATIRDAGTTREPDNPLHHLLYQHRLFQDAKDNTENSQDSIANLVAMSTHLPHPLPHLLFQDAKDNTENSQDSIAKLAAMSTLLPLNLLQNA
jgi:hypothetical protein